MKNLRKTLTKLTNRNDSSSIYNKDSNFTVFEILLQNDFIIL